MAAYEVIFVLIEFFLQRRMTFNGIGFDFLSDLERAAIKIIDLHIFPDSRRQFTIIIRFCGRENKEMITINIRFYDKKNGIYRGCEKNRCAL